jgi:hypothetical protein
LFDLWLCAICMTCATKPLPQATDLRISPVIPLSLPAPTCTYLTCAFLRLFHFHFPPLLVRTWNWVGVEFTYYMMCDLCYVRSSFFCICVDTSIEITLTHIPFRLWSAFQGVLVRKVCCEPFSFSMCLASVLFWLRQWPVIYVIVKVMFSIVLHFSVTFSVYYYFSLFLLVFLLVLFTLPPKQCTISATKNAVFCILCISGSLHQRC